MIKKIILHKLSGFVMKLSKSLKWIFRRLKRKHKMEVKDKMMKKEWRKFGTKKKSKSISFQLLRHLNRLNSRESCLEMKTDHFKHSKRMWTLWSLQQKRHAFISTDWSTQEVCVRVRVSVYACCLSKYD